MRKALPDQIREHVLSEINKDLHAPAGARSLSRSSPSISNCSGSAHSPVTCSTTSRRCAALRCSNRKYPLPCSKRELALRDRHAERGVRERRFDMRRHVVRPFDAVNDPRRVVRDDAAEEFLEIAQHVRIGVFLDHQRSRGVPAIERELPHGDAARFDECVRLAGELRKAPARSWRSSACAAAASWE